MREFMNKTKLVLSISLLIGISTVYAKLNQNLENATQDVVQAKKAIDNNPSPNNQQALNQALNELNNITNNSSDSETISLRASVAESEPNGTSGTANTITTLNTDYATGDITPAGDRDWWTVSGVTAGDFLFVLIDSTVSGTGTDTEMSVFRADGTTLIGFDDDSGDSVASAVTAIAPATEDIFIELNEFGDNGTIEPYNIFISSTAPGATIAEAEPNDTFATAQVVSGPLVITGDLGDTTDDFFAFEAVVGSRYGIVVNNDPDVDLSFTDAELTALDTDGTTVLASEAPFTVTAHNAVAFTATNTGTHFILVADGAGADSDYSLVIIGPDGLVPVELQNFSID
jgi:hypothetical protein